MITINPSPAVERDKKIIKIVSIVIFCALTLHFLARSFFFNTPPDNDVLVTLIIFSIPVISSFLGWLKISKIALSWSPTFAVLYIFIHRFRIEGSFSVEQYDAAKIFLLGFSTIPFLLLDSKDRPSFLLGISVSVIGTLLCDQVFDFFGVGPAVMGAHEEPIRFNSLRTIASYLVLSGSAFSLRFIVDKGERLNQKLVTELEQKNQIIKTQADTDVAYLNTQLQENFDKLLKYTRELALLNTVNDIVSNVRSVNDLFEKLCREMVNEGGYKLVWIGQLPSLIGDDTVVKHVKCYGETAYLKDLVIDLKNENHQKGPTARLLLHGVSAVTNEISKDPNFEAWSSLATAHGFNSSAGVCIKAEPVGRYALNMYSGSPDSFDKNEIAILERIAINVANTIKSIHATNERDTAKRELQRTYERLNYHVNNTPLAVIERDEHLKITHWSKRAEELFGWKQSEVIGKRTDEFLVPENDREVARVNITEMVEGDFVTNFREIRNVSKSGKILYCNWYYSMLKDENSEMQGLLSLISDVTEQKSSDHKLKERIKELTTMYRASLILSKGNQDVDKILETIVQILPQGWQYPEICAARIQLFGKEYRSANYVQSQFKQTAKLEILREEVGFIEVVYLRDTPHEMEGPFLLEERSLIHVIAEMLQIYVERMREEDALNKAQANLMATINNTEILIWSVDKDFNLLTFNEPFERYIKEHHNLQIKVGVRVLTSNRLFSESILSKEWETRYLQVLAGETIIIEETRFGIDLKFSLSPIIEKGEVIGVSVFAANMTERNKHDRELMEANRQIGELKVMALRSVMNPHFVFNVLNSIQFFIAKNDRLNAINYLSTFSKLIRTVLTHSVAEKIKLTEELDMLKNYIELEKVRFEDKFNYKIEIDPETEVDTIALPSLLVQPYIENAILHGLNNKEGRGELMIRVRAEEEYLIFEIEDNGIGREAAAKLKNDQTTHKSMGTQLTEERLRVLNQHSGHGVLFEDLKNEAQVLGTRVTIKIKI